MTEFQVVQGDFVDALGDALIAAADNVALPLFGAVYLEGAKGEQSITFTATDQFILLQRRIPTVAPLPEDVAALIPRNQAKMLIDFHKADLRARRGPGDPLTVNVDDTYLTAGQISGLLARDQEFVKYHSLWPAKTSQVETFGLNLALIGRLAKLSVFGRGKAKHVRITFGANARSPLNVSISGREDDTRILVMPTRLPDES